MNEKNKMSDAQNEPHVDANAPEATPDNPTPTNDEDILTNALDEFDTIRNERDTLKDRLLRSLAEIENIRKRAERDRREAERYGGSKLARDLLPIYDNLRRALDVVDEDQRTVANGVIEGVELTLRELLNIFAKHSITPITPQIGDTFDPQHHQAMFEAPVPNTTAGEIIQIAAEGFLLHDRLLRPAQVGVSSNTAPKVDGNTANPTDDAQDESVTQDDPKDP